MVQQFHTQIFDPRATVIYGPPNYRKYSFVFCFALGLFLLLLTPHPFPLFPYGASGDYGK